MTIEELKKIKDSFVAELIDSAENKKTSLPFIRHDLPRQSLVKEGEIFQVFVLGGTVFRAAICKKQDKKIIILSQQESIPPKFLTKKDFISWIIPYVDPSVRVIALNFAYPVKPLFQNNYLDGVLISGTKENVLEGLVGELVGKSISQACLETYKKNITVTVA
ncbi:MAG TPA: hypothetical protein PLD54_05005, partial [Candidatus Levybacteria bacterium]|nr:hypothetical protein [Candidatus Levybacteria bacterium]